MSPLYELQVWIGNSTTHEATKSQIYVMELSPNGILTQQPEKMAFLPDLRIACMTPILFDNRPPVLLVSCLTGGLWRYDLTSAESQPQAHRIANLQEHSAVFCICHDKRTNFIIAGLANGCIAVLTREQVLDTSDPVSVSILKQLGDGKAPVSDICLYDGLLWCACGSQVYAVNPGTWEVQPQGIEVPDR